LLVSFLSTNNLTFCENNHLYSTWNNLEVDKCASAWLIVRFIDPQASFRFYSPGELISEGIPFDTPDSEIRRTFNKTAFEVIMGKYNISDPAIKKLADIIRDVEINLWAQKKYKLSEELNLKINEIIKNLSSPEEALKNSFKIFDSIYDQIKKGKTTSINKN